MTFETSSYRLSRTQLAYLAAGEYMRTFWWFFGIVPLFGLVAMVFATGLLQIIGMFALLWPFSIPARSILTTSKASRLFTGGCRLFVFEDRFEFRGETPEKKSGKPLRYILKREMVRDVVRRGDYLVVRTIKMQVAPVPLSAFGSDAEIASLTSREA